eukprot:c19924_g1_i1.p1 GENE.c19924_g1_i1~~c19924_g1_i1.p1  ORF type:complete len:867 (-),score=192.78 c19924_g1_i1:92-2494(-)
MLEPNPMETNAIASSFVDITYGLDFCLPIFHSLIQDRIAFTDEGPLPHQVFKDSGVLTRMIASYVRKLSLVFIPAAVGALLHQHTAPLPCDPSPEQLHEACLNFITALLDSRTIAMIPRNIRMLCYAIHDAASSRPDVFPDTVRITLVASVVLNHLYAPPLEQPDEFQLSPTPPPVRDFILSVFANMCHQALPSRGANTALAEDSRMISEQLRPNLERFALEVMTDPRLQTDSGETPWRELFDAPDASSLDFDSVRPLSLVYFHLALAPATNVNHSTTASRNRNDQSSRSVAQLRSLLPRSDMKRAEDDEGFSHSQLHLPTSASSTSQSLMMAPHNLSPSSSSSSNNTLLTTSSTSNCSAAPQPQQPQPRDLLSLFSTSLPSIPSRCNSRSVSGDDVPEHTSFDVREHGNIVDAFDPEAFHLGKNTEGGTSVYCIMHKFTTAIISKPEMFRDHIHNVMHLAIKANKNNPPTIDLMLDMSHTYLTPHSLYQMVAFLKRIYSTIIDRAWLPLIRNIFVLNPNEFFHLIRYCASYLEPSITHINVRETCFWKEFRDSKYLLKNFKIAPDSQTCVPGAYYGYKKLDKKVTPCVLSVSHTSLYEIVDKRITREARLHSLTRLVCQQSWVIATFGRVLEQVALQNVSNQQTLGYGFTSESRATAFAEELMRAVLVCTRDNTSHDRNTFPVRKVRKVGAPQCELRCLLLQHDAMLNVSGVTLKTVIPYDKITDISFDMDTRSVTVTLGEAPEQRTYTYEELDDPGAFCTQLRNYQTASAKGLEEAKQKLEQRLNDLALPEILSTEFV